MGVVGAGEVVDVIGRLGEPGAEAVDQRLQPFEQGLVAGVQARQAFAGGFGSSGQGRKVDADEAAIFNPHFTPDHDGIDGTAVLGVDQLVGGVVAGDPVDVGEVEEHQVGLVALGDPTEFVGKTQRPAAADGGGLENLLAPEPAIVVGSLGAGAVGGDAERFVHVLIVAAGSPVRANADVELPVQHGAHRGNTVAQQHVAAGVVRHGGAVVGQPLNVVGVEPDPVRGDEVGA